MLGRVDEMKLRGTRTESIIRDVLIFSDLSLKGNKAIMDFLCERYGNVRSVYAMAWTPSQGEDACGVLVNGEIYVSFDICTSSEEIREVEEITVSEYLKSIRGRRSILKVLIALDLANSG